MPKVKFRANKIIRTVSNNQNIRKKLKEHNYIYKKKS